jgi:hypothetical protein
LEFAGACTRPAQPTEPTAAEVSKEELDSLWSAALSVLRKYDFTPDRQDRAQGVITTLPSTSMQWGEAWRRDVATPYDYAHSSLHTTQRQVTVRFIHGEQWTLQVQVDIYRLSADESQITTASSAMQAFSGVLPSTEGGYQYGSGADKDWRPLGRDGAMESRLLDSILAYSVRG